MKDDIYYASGKLKHVLNPLALRSHKEIADELGISRQRVQQLEKEALKKCRKLLTFNNMTSSKDLT